MANTDIRDHVRRAIAGQRSAITRIGRFIHAHPEEGFQEKLAADRLTAYLASLGFKVTRPYAGLDTAFRAVLKGGKARPRIAVFAEYDALSGLGHGCGHNLISTAALAAAAGVAGCVPDNLPGQFEIIGTPAEESRGGKVEMIRQKAFAHLDAAIMAHPAVGSKITVGCLARKGFKAEFRGRAAHAAGAPQEGINALDAVILFFNGVNALRQHLREDARIHGIVTHGGDACNVIPERAAIEVGVRSLDEEYLHELCKRVEACCRGAARSIGAGVTLKWDSRWYRSFQANLPLDQVVIDGFADVGIDLPQGMNREGRGSLDMGNVSRVIPAAHPYFRIVPPGMSGVALHTREFLKLANTPRAYKAAIAAGTGMALAVLRLLDDPGLMRRIRRAFNRSG